MGLIAPSGGRWDDSPYQKPEDHNELEESYSKNVISILHYVADALPMQKGENLQELRSIFREAAGYIMTKISDPREDVAGEIKALADVAKRQPPLRHEAVDALSSYYNARTAEITLYAHSATREALTDFLKDADPAVRLAAAEGLGKVAVWTVLEPLSSWNLGGKEFTKEEFAGALSGALGREKDPQVATALRGVIDVMQKTELARIRAAVPVLKR